jgi:hypothetical protein
MRINEEIRGGVASVQNEVAYFVRDREPLPYKSLRLVVANNTMSFLNNQQARNIFA